jgi:hypothetical protein
MADNTEFTPIYTEVERPHFRTDFVIRGANNIISPTAKNIICFGDNNYIGEDCENISMMNSSACIVSPGVRGVVLMNTSGVTISENDTVYIQNQNVTSGSFVSNTANVRIIMGSDTALITDDILIIPTSSETITIPSCSTLGINKRYEIKNISDGDIYLYTDSSDGFDRDTTNPPVVDTITLAMGEAVVLIVTDYGLGDVVLIL